MQNKQQVFLYIKDEIERIVLQEEKKILQEAKEIEEEAYRQIKNEASIDAKHQLDKELASISAQASIDSAMQMEKSTKALVEKRESYIENIFNEVKEKLIAFTKTEKYSDYLVSHVQKNAQEYAMKDCILYLKKNDMKYAEELQVAYKFPIEVEESENIIIGGFIIENKNSHIVIDETLESHLENQKEWFFKNSGLMIK